MSTVRTAGMSTAARRRRRRAGLVLTALFGLLLAVLLYAVAYYQGWLPAEGDAGTADDVQQTTSAPVEEVPEPGEVQVNVFNGAGFNGEDRPGLARRTADALGTLGYDVQDVDDDPEQQTFEEPALIRHGPDSVAEAEVLLDSVPGAVLAPDERETAVVDLVLGVEFVELTEDDDETATSTE